jgi:N-acetylglucosaminyldiphosphoundecaprenol N-acetyl-beta-D-mannosaminyltransferase
VDASRIYVTGNTVVDALHFIVEKIERDRDIHRRLDETLGFLQSNRKLVLVTGHRRESFGAGFERICRALARIAQREDVEIVYPVHLNPNVVGPVNRALCHFSNVHLIPPTDYVSFVHLLSRASAIITDSGGVQEEAASLGKRVLVMRDKTERPEGVEAGFVQLVGTDPDLICVKLDEILDKPPPLSKAASSVYGDGKASARIVAALADDLPARAHARNRSFTGVSPNMAPAHELDWARSSWATPQNGEAAPAIRGRQGGAPIRVEILGAPIDVLSMEDTVSRARDAMREKSPIVQVSMNVAKLVDMRRNPELRHDVLSSDIVNADGMGVVLAGRLLGLQLRSRVAGIDLMMALLALCARDGFRPYFLGATHDVVRSAAAAAVERFPGLRLAGTHHGYFGQEQEAAIIEEIRAADPDCLFVGMPTPRKERFLQRQRGALGAPFVMGVGGSFDILAGNVRRAPRWMQESGLEWAYRVYQEPGRMWWRYARTNAVFGCLLVRALMQSRQLRLGGGSVPR